MQAARDTAVCVLTCYKKLNARIERICTLPICRAGYEFSVAHWYKYPMPTLWEQARAVSAADIVIGPHGAGLTWVYFQPPGSFIVELFSVPRTDPSCYLQLACKLGHGYRAVDRVNQRGPQGVWQALQDTAAKWTSLQKVS